MKVKKPQSKQRVKPAAQKPAAQRTVTAQKPAVQGTVTAPIAVPLPTSPARIVIGPPPTPGLGGPLIPIESVPTSLDGQRSTEPDRNVVALFLTHGLLSVIENIGKQALEPAAPPDYRPLYRPNVRAAWATLLGADLTRPNEAAVVDKDLAAALEAYQGYLSTMGAGLSLVERLKVLINDQANHPAPIP